ncbi:hypothetical protein DGMP_28980 [Desulfomarina profundi]|uniref:Uncharacterized protein n=1 Tax=Desulfomarina profundi TaxID=2772557 RepID=A0A8D5FR51_9BACT|nr:hypothetical protein [Desulfomarina profundi]BCL62205.1 hypothetical protein DGMP_28980 [Desulfomarina profundi]
MIKQDILSAGSKIKQLARTGKLKLGRMLGGKKKRVEDEPQKVAAGAEDQKKKRPQKKQQPEGTRVSAPENGERKNRGAWINFRLSRFPEKVVSMILIFLCR